ncbi:MAG: hypothetical protein ACRDGM_14740, partial [bacterium]
DPARPYVSREVSHGVFVHIDPKTKKVVGFALHHFSQDFSGKPAPVPLAATFQQLKDAKRDLVPAR